MQTRRFHIISTFFFSVFFGLTVRHEQRGSPIWWASMALILLFLFRGNTICTILRLQPFPCRSIISCGVGETFSEHACCSIARRCNPMNVSVEEYLAVPPNLLIRPISIFSGLYKDQTVPCVFIHSERIMTKCMAGNRCCAPRS